jgi:small subunit ribosomal protein S5
LAEKFAQDKQLSEKVLSINRVAKVTKGGKKMSFSALLVVGDGKGKVGFGYGKANEVAEAIRKGLVDARKGMFEVPRVGYTIPHEVTGKYGAGKVLLKPASPGTGVIAGGPIRALCDAAGIKDILSKSLGSDNSVNVIKAAVEALKNLSNKEENNRIKGEQSK